MEAKAAIDKENGSMLLGKRIDVKTAVRNTNKQEQPNDNSDNMNEMDQSHGGGVDEWHRQDFPEENDYRGGGRGRGGQNDRGRGGYDRGGGRGGFDRFNDRGRGDYDRGGRRGQGGLPGGWTQRGLWWLDDPWELCKCHDRVISSPKCFEDAQNDRDNSNMWSKFE